MLKSWLGTPYRLYTRRKRLGADCREFVCGFLDEMYHRPGPTLVPLVARDLAAHDGVKASEFAMIVRKKYPSFRVRPDDDGVIEVMPGDIIVLRVTRNSGPGHVMIVGNGRGQFWEASNFSGKIDMTGAPNMKDVIAVYRAKRREIWAVDFRASYLEPDGGDFARKSGLRS